MWHERAIGYGFAVGVVNVLVDGTRVSVAVAAGLTATEGVVVATFAEVPSVIRAGVRLVDFVSPPSADLVDPGARAYNASI